MNLKEFLNSMQTPEEKEWSNIIIAMALRLRQQLTLRRKYDQEMQNKKKN